MQEATMITLPWPPSVNHYWRSVVIGRSARVLISKEGRQYQTTVQREVERQLGKPDPLAGRLAVHITAYPPDRKRRDLDNLGKSLLDSLCHAGIYLDDSQIDDLRLIRGSVCKPGSVSVQISEASNEVKA